MATHREWLPASAVERGVRDAPVRTVVADWSSRWFMHGEMILRRIPVLKEGIVAGEATGWSLGDGLTLIRKGGARRAIADLLFGPQDDAEPPTPADESVLRTAVESCLADLRARLATAFRLPADDPWRPSLPTDGSVRRWIWSVDAGRDESPLGIAVDEELIVRRVRAGVPPVARASALTPLASALANQAVSVSALVGRCRLTTSEVAGLGEGDVVVLDRTIGDKVDLAVGREPKALSCQVEERDLHLILTNVEKRNERP